MTLLVTMLASQGNLTPQHPPLHSTMFATNVRLLSRSGRGGAWAQAARLHRAVPAPASTPPGARFAAQAASTRSLAAAAVQAPEAAQSSSQAPPRSLAPGEVHLWWLHPSKVEGAGALQRYSRLLTAEELRDCHTSSSPAVVRERLLARALVRSVLSQYATGAPPPERLLFDRNQHGKPALAWPSVTNQGHRLHFNLTHTTSLIGLSVAAEALVGLDVEGSVRRARDPLRLAQRRFSEGEIRDLQAAPEGPARDALFLQLWTLKEAYVKALGRGISAPPGLSSFAFRLNGWEEQQQQGQHQDARPGVWVPGGQLQDRGGSGGGDDALREGHLPHGGACSIEFSRSPAAAALESRDWQFLLLRPSPEHVAALCLERLGGAAGSSAAAACSFSAFEGMPSEEPCSVQLEVLGLGNSD